ncbi:hypothetical protein WA026_003343 [Henosepilachna vigintioctopunctata]|uniref:Uncharacterized protein n=1 Tax=Henosepilachna vigintioctopunctata TaxID=420089 RepID=A0AAW1TLV7_9CUCU
MNVNYELLNQQKISSSLNILQEICNIYIIISVFAIGLESQTLHFYLVLILVAFLITAVLLLNKYVYLMKTNTAYLWIEFGYGFSNGILIAIMTTILVATSEKTTGYILIFITGYTNSILYFADALDKYRSAINSRKKVYWNRPVHVLLVTEGVENFDEMALKTEYLRTIPGTLKIFEIIFSFLGLLMSLLFDNYSGLYFDISRTYTFVSGIALLITGFLLIVNILGLDECMLPILQYQKYLYLILMMFVLSYSSIMLYNSTSKVLLVIGGVSGILLAVTFLVDGISGFNNDPLLPK